MENTFNLKKYLAEGILLKEKQGILPNLEKYIELTDLFGRFLKYQFG